MTACAPRHPERDYGKLGRVGVLTPEANPTVESEFRVLLPDGMAMVVGRLTSRAATLEQRLLDYIERVGDCLDSFDTLRPDVVTFACTGSTYLLGRTRELELLAAESRRFGAPMISATQAIHAALQALGARRIAIIAPYPEFLLEAGCEYWQALGYAVTAHGRIATGSADVRAIYELTSDVARARLRELKPENCDAVLLSGTGMPTVPLVLAHEDFTSRPVLSSNWCLAGRALAELGLTLEPAAVTARLARAQAV